MLCNCPLMTLTLIKRPPTEAASVLDHFMPLLPVPKDDQASAFEPRRYGQLDN